MVFYGWLNASYPDETCCVSVPYVPVTQNHRITEWHQAMDEMHKIAEQSRELCENMKQKTWEWMRWI